MTVPVWNKEQWKEQNANGNLPIYNVSGSFFMALKEMLDDYVEQLRLHNVVGQSEQFYCHCSRAKGLDYDEEGMPYCIECQKPVQ